jgi:hypothetical protein
MHHRVSDETKVFWLGTLLHYEAGAVDFVFAAVLVVSWKLNKTPKVCHH